MSAAERAEAAYLTRWLDRRGDNAFEAAADSRFESGGHSVRGLAHGNHEDAMEGVEIVQVVANAQDAAFAVHVTGEGAFDGSVLQCGGEDLAGNRSEEHTSEL